MSICRISQFTKSVAMHLNSAFAPHFRNFCESPFYFGITYFLSSIISYLADFRKPL